MFENVQSILDIVIPVAGGITIGTIIVFIGVLIIKAVVSKTVNSIIVKADTEKITDKAVKEGVKTLEKVHFTHNIEPIAKSELMKVTEQANKYWEERAIFFEKKWQDLFSAFKTFTEFFDNSIGVPADKKAELKEKLAKLENGTILDENDRGVVLEPSPADKVPSSQDNETKTGVMVKR